jgi:hypothetical protein
MARFALRAAATTSLGMSSACTLMTGPDVLSTLSRRGQQQGVVAAGGDQQPPSKPANINEQLAFLQITNPSQSQRKTSFRENKIQLRGGGWIIIETKKCEDGNQQ